MKKITDAINPKDTVVILSAKHGQSPLSRAALTLIDDGEVTDALNAEWAKTHANPQLVAFSINDDGMLMWLSDRSGEATRFAKNFLWNYHVKHAGGSDANGNLVDKTATTLHSGRGASDQYLRLAVLATHPSIPPAQPMRAR